MLSANARREEIYHLAVTTGLASVEELSARFEVTASTIRRDLALLNGQGRLARTYGGAMAMGAHPEASLRQRTGEAFEQKHAIARWAASVIVPGENILLDAGSTVGALAHELRGFEKLSVTTPGINTMQELPTPKASKWTAWAAGSAASARASSGPWPRRPWNG
jgi:DeoR/GlpR family transcriptional regulator of sugar metabolism